MDREKEGETPEEYKLRAKYAYYDFVFEVKKREKDLDAAIDEVLG
jgi:hypothetical protein